MRERPTWSLDAASWRKLEQATVSSYSYTSNVLTAGTSQFSGSTHFAEVAFVFYNLLGDGDNNSVATDPFLNKQLQPVGAADDPHVGELHREPDAESIGRFLLL
jgi:hypothetical protein